MKCREALIARADDFHIILDDIAITHLTFGREYAQAVEMKQVAQQEAERARFVVERAEQEKVANIIRAEGDSKAAELISQSLQQFGTGLIELRKIEVCSATDFVFSQPSFFVVSFSDQRAPPSPRPPQAAKDIAATMSRSRNVAYLPGGNNMLLNLQL
jgi:prohibitin 1